MTQISNDPKDFIVKNSKTNFYEIDVKNINDFLKETNRILCIPKYQRPYSWEQKEVLDLINDIKKSAINNENWFIGTIFTTLDDNNLNIKEILDGQQRLTTIILILRCFTTLNFKFPNEFNKLNFLPIDYAAETNFTELKTNFENEFNNRKETILDDLLIKHDRVDYKKVYKSKFLTDQGTREIFQDYIIATRSISNVEDFQKHNSLQFSANNHDYSPTLARINKNITTIESELGKLIQNDSEVDIIKFIDTLLNNLVFIEIPLYSKKNILDIFESLNNRGKSLSLSDLLRFLTLKSSFDNSTSYESIERDWYRIYELSENSINRHGFFKDLDEFLERFINSISDSTNGYTTNHSRIERFKTLYEKDFSKGTEDILKVLDNLDYLFSSDNGYLKNINSSYKARIYPLLILIKRILKVNENSQIFFFQYLRSKFQKVNEPIFNGEAEVYHLTEFFKSAFYIEILNNISSNQARPKFIQLANFYGTDNTFNPTKQIGNKTEKQNEKIKDDESDLKSLNEIKKFKNIDKNLIKNLIFTKSKDVAEIVLFTYQLITDIDNFPKKIDDKNDVQLEHIIPQKWNSNKGWQENLDFNSISDLLLIYKMKDEKFHLALKEFFDDEDFFSPASPSKSFVQLIGNKVQIYGRTNNDLANNYWNEHPYNNKNGGKKNYLKNSFSNNPNNSTLIPTKPKMVFDNENFNLSTIIEITYDIYLKFKDDFDDFKIKIS